MWEVILLHPYVWGLAIISVLLVLVSLIFKKGDFWMYTFLGVFMFVFLAAGGIFPESYSIVIFLLVALLVGFGAATLFIRGGG